MKEFLKRFRQLNKERGRRGSALVTVICVTSVALILILALYSLAYYALNKSVGEVTEQKATYNAESIAKMISDDLTSGNKGKYTKVLETLKDTEIGTEITYNLNNEKLGNTKVVFKREENRPKNVIMRVTTTLGGHKGFVKVRFRLKQEGDNTGAILEEVEKIFDNTVYTGSFPSGLIGSLNNVDFAGDIVIKLDEATNVGSDNEEAGIVFGDGDTKTHNGNLIVIFGDSSKTLYLRGGQKVMGNVVTDGNMKMYYGSSVGGSIIAQGNIELGISGPFQSVGTEQLEGGIALIAGKKVKLNADNRSVINGDVYVGEGFENQHYAKINGKIYASGGINTVKMTTGGDGYITMKPQGMEEKKVKESLASWETPSPTGPLGKTEAVAQGYIVPNWTYDDGTTIVDKIDSLTGQLYSDIPTPVWYAPNDFTTKPSTEQVAGEDIARSDKQSGSPEETWHSFNGVESQIGAKYAGVDLTTPVGSGVYDYTYSAVGGGFPQVKTINKSGYISQSIVNERANPQASKLDGGTDLVSLCQKTIVFDTTGGNIHVKLKENIIFDDTDVVVLGNNFVYFYTEQFRIDIGSNTKDNVPLAVNNTMDKYINFGVSVDVTTNKRMYNDGANSSGAIKAKGNGNGNGNNKNPVATTTTTTTTGLAVPRIFVTSSYGETENDVKVAGGVKKTGNKTIYPFLCINNNACAFAYLYAPYRPVVISESYWNGNTLQLSSKLTQDEAYKFMGSLCVNRIDDHKDPSTAQYGGANEYAYGIGLFRVRSGVYKRMYYFNPADTEGAFDGIIFNKECLGNDEDNTTPIDPTQPGNPLEDSWSLEAFL